jgi:hypothetical protein
VRHILLHHPWLWTYLVIVACMFLAFIWDRFWHPPPPEKPTRPGEGGPTTPPGIAETSRTQGSGRIVKSLCPAMPRKSGLTGIRKRANG